MMPLIGAALIAIGITVWVLTTLWICGCFYND